MTAFLPIIFPTYVDNMCTTYYLGFPPHTRATYLPAFVCIITHFQKAFLFGCFFTYKTAPRRNIVIVVLALTHSPSKRIISYKCKICLLDEYPAKNITEMPYYKQK